MNLLLLSWLRWIEWGIRSLRIAGYASSGRQLLVIVGAIPIAGPLPNVPGHVEQAISIRRILRDCSNPYVPVLTGIFHRERTLMSVGHPFAVGSEFFAPDVGLSA